MNQRVLSQALLLLGCLTSLSCQSAREAQLARDLARLDEEVRELKRSRTEHRARLDDLSAKLMLLQDRQESALASRESLLHPQELPVIRLGPQEPAEGSYSVIRSGEDPPERVVQPQGGGRRGFSLETANRAGIDPGERLPVAPLPPPGFPAAQQPPALDGAQPGAAAEAKKTRGDASSLPVPAAEPEEPVPPPTGQAKKEYELAFGLFQSGKLDPARKVFERFVQLYPRHDLTDNSIYWMGEISYKQQRFEEALELFGRVIEAYPTGNKVPDAFLKIGLCYLNLGKDDAARKILQQVQTIFPESAAARIALSHLKLL